MSETKNITLNSIASSLTRTLKRLLTRSPSNSNPNEPYRLTSKKLGLSSKLIDRNAMKVLRKLHDAGYEAYLVGGSVRDMLCGITPKDFDIATNAHPEQVHHLFRNSRLIGRRFRLVHVFFGREVIEVATFRAMHSQESEHIHRTEKGMILRDNRYGSMAEDAWRRDFSINALYYDVFQGKIIDYAGGIKDIQHRQIHILGEAKTRYEEDPVRMLRAVRLAAKLNFTIHADTASPIRQLNALLLHVSNARLFDEIIKLFHSGKSLPGFELLRHHGLFAILFPQTEESFSSDQGNLALEFVRLSLENTDHRVNQGLSLNPAFIFAVLLWSPLQLHAKKREQNKATQRGPSIYEVMSDILRQQSKITSIPRRFSIIIREIWSLQHSLQVRNPSRIYNAFTHMRFRAAFDFLELRSKLDPSQKLCVEWWRNFQAGSESERQHLIKQLPRPTRRRRRKVKK
jgi:poly(A) polymerase